MSETQAMSPMPRYKCHKLVWALKIKNLKHSEEGRVFVEFEEAFDSVLVANYWYEKFKPVAGGYYVTYEDGYTSFSPAAAFESGYTPYRGMGIGDAIREMRNGKRVARWNWNGKNMWLALQVPDAHSKMGLPYVYMSTVDGRLVPWLASQTDLLAEDWFVVASEEWGVTLTSDTVNDPTFGLK